MNRSLLYPRATTTRRLIGLDGMWRFSFDPESKGVEAGWALDLPSSLSMPVPASFCDLFTDKASREYCGDFWYETSFFVPAEWSGWDIVLRFGSVTHRARVFVNGVEVAQHEGGFLPFDATVTNIVRYNQFNKLSVLANNELSETMLPAGTTRTLADGRKIAAPYFDFYNYAGIHRPVWLMALPKERVLDYSTRYRLTETGAEIDYTVSTNGPHPVTVELYDGTTRVAESSGTTGTLVVKNAKLWNIHAAYLYDLVIRIHEGSAVVDEYLDRIGIRTFEIRHGRFLLNGSPVYLRGFGRHEDADIRGRGLDLPTVKRDFELMKWIGANCFRTSHYPYAEEIYQMADEEGFLIIDEVPAVGFMQSTANFLAANQGNGRQQGFFEKETTPALLKNHKAALTDMIDRDKNHPSVIAWSLLNEPQCTSAGTEEYFKPLFELARRLGAQVYTHTDWRGYGIQRQRAQDYATGDWVLMIDTDERVTPELRQAILKVLDAPQRGAIYSIARRNYFLGRFMRHSGWYPDRVLRLYERARYRYNDNLVHESLDSLGAEVIPLTGDLLHLTCRDFAGFQQKQLAYAAAWALERHQKGKKTSMAGIFSHTLGAFLKTLLLRGGVLDGKQGWLLAMVNAQYTFTKYTELWALSHGYSEKESS